ncbi:MAG: geranylgeranyl reductase family protein [bacterium]
MKNCYDIIVVGGGPVGSYTAQRLSQNGFDVCVLEQKSVIGDDVVCTGLISKESFQRYELPTESILTRILSFSFISPRRQVLKYTHPDIFAYVVNRSIFDKKLAERAQHAGVRYWLGVRVDSIEESVGYYRVCANGKSWKGRSVVIATGVNYKLQRKLGLGKPKQFLYGSQIELPRDGDDTDIEIHISGHYIPNSFAWVAPVNRKMARVGMILEKRGKGYLQRFIKERLNFNNYPNLEQGIAVKPIAYGPINKSATGKIIVVGEAAGQVKTTTGGGIFMGLFCADIAVEKITKALQKGTTIKDYDITWRSALSSELEIGRKVRQVASQFNDRIIERLFTFIKHNQIWVDFLTPRINFDFHSDLFYYCLKAFTFLLKNP